MFKLIFLMENNIISKRLTIYIFIPINFIIERLFQSHFNSNS